MDSHCVNFFIETLDSLKQLHSVDEFYLRIDNLMNLILASYPGMGENYFLSRFIQGLKHELRVYVLQCQPTTLLDVYELALNQKYELEAQRRRIVLFTRKST